MPVSRNLSLPASIQGRKYKKRLDAVNEMQKNLQQGFRESAPMNDAMCEEASSPSLSVAKKLFTLPTSPTDLNSATPSSETTATPSRTTLSQPCIGSSPVRATSIFPHLFLGSESDVSDQQLMADQRITRVLNVSTTCQRPPHMDDDHFRRIAVHDNYTERIEPFLDEAVQFLEEARENSERVLVHCVAGVSRSATIAIAYVMYYLKLNQNDAYRFVKEKRPTISPNFNFLGQLIEFERKLRENGHLPLVDNQPPSSEKVNSDAKPQLVLPTRHQKVAETNTSGFSTKNLFKNTSMNSSFCRRRQGPKLDLTGRGKSECDKSNGSLSMSTRGAGVVLDLHVQAPSSGEQHSRRLGSDGVEDERQEDFDQSSSSDQQEEEESQQQLRLQLPLNGSKQKANSLPRRLPTTGNNAITQQQATSINLLHHDEFDYGLKSQTAPNTPAAPSMFILRTNGETAELDEYPQDVEMSQDSDGSSSSQNQQQPPSPIFHLNRNPIDSNVLYMTSYASQPIEYHNNRYATRKNRSPKIMKKTFTPSLRQSFGYQAFLTSKANSGLQMPAASSLKVRPDQSLRPRFCTSPGATDRFSTLSLSSPNVHKIDDHHQQQQQQQLCVNGKSFAKKSRTADVTSLPTPAFKLVPSSELRMRWRSKSRHAANNGASPSNGGGKQQGNGGGAGTNPEGISTTTTTSSPSGAALSCCNMEIVSCS